MDPRHPYYYNTQFSPSNDEFLPFSEENSNFHGEDSQFPSHQPSQPSYQPSQTSHQYCGTSVPQSRNSKPPSKQPATRHNNWTKDEDEALCWAWLSITSDAITGADQSKKKLWDRILEQYIQHIGVPPTERNDVALMNRWSVVQQKISKFFGCMTTIEMNRPSGFSSDDMMLAAKDLFRSQTGGQFKLESCWEILKHNNKWNSHYAEQVGKGKKKKEPKKRSGFDFDINESIGHSLPSTPSSHAGTTDGASTEESPHIGENDSPGVEEYQLQRPAGRKAAKQRRAKINSANELQTSFVSKFNNITTRFESRQEKMQDAQVAREVRKMEKEKTRQLEIKEKQRLEEKELMLTDPNSAPTEAGKAWIIARQNEILASMNSRSAPKFP